MTDKNKLHTVRVNFFYRDNNPDCQITREALYKIMDNYIEKITMREINFDHNKKICDAYNVYGVPTLLIIKSNKILNRYSGILDSREIQSVLDLLLERH
jgi:thioredoxin 1